MTQFYFKLPQRVSVAPSRTLSVFSPFLMMTPLLASTKKDKHLLYCNMREKMSIKIEENLAVCAPPTLPMNESHSSKLERSAFTASEKNVHSARVMEGTHTHHTAAPFFKGKTRTQKTTTGKINYRCQCCLPNIHKNSKMVCRLD